MNIPDKDSLAKSLDKAAYTLDKAYLNYLKRDYNVADFGKYAESQGGINYENNIRVIKIGYWVKESGESIIDCFKNVLSVFAAAGGNNVALVIKCTVEKIDMYLALRSTGSNAEFARTSLKLLQSSIDGNFKGTKCDDEVSHEKIEKELFGEFGNSDNSNIQSISSVCGVPSEKSKEFISQGIEKLLEGVVPSNDKECYTLVILAEPINAVTAKNVINGYEELASALTPFATEQFQNSKNEGVMEGETDSTTVSNTINEAITKTHSINTNIGVGIGLGKIVKLNGSVGYGYSGGKINGTAKTDSETHGTNYSVSFGITEGSTYTYKSYPIANLIEKAEKTIKRIQNGQANGLWSYAVYVLSPMPYTSKNVAGYISGLLQGDESYIETPIVNEWSKIDKTSPTEEERQSAEKFNNILSYIKKFSHPIFVNAEDKTKVTATSYVSTSELSAVFAFPKHSIHGLPVIECARFGREPYSLGKLKKDLKVGHAYHMHKEEDQPIKISKDELTKHAFITGSTGSGKSNTIYHLINELCLKDNNNETKFLVIEPAKGEYKNVFYDPENPNKVSVYGTNPDFTPMLRLNPFSFPDGIHILEHLDRLVEIFNVCWPMYAAMPAVLKNAVEKAYEDCGWNLVQSVNKYDREMYPTFADIAKNVKKIIDSSEYDAENKGAYKGSLLTRLQSLTNGINGLIFCNNEISNKMLFDENVIVDLSRVGSSETKSLIMGMLVLKLQEYRMTTGEMNASLKHITVFEEAHNLLKRTSTEHTSETANLVGKSVEMLSNAIAEMRTYGEGFIIADQSPGLLDMAAIRNTNTKIIMRLPDISDRELVGKAANLNEEQITELAKLPCGVAAVYQNEWIQPVLCKVKKYDTEGKKYSYQPIKKEVSSDSSYTKLFAIADLLCNGTKLSEAKIANDVIPELTRFNIKASVVVDVARCLENPSSKPRMTRLAPIVSAFFPKLKQEMVEVYTKTSDPADWTRCINNTLISYMEQKVSDQTRRDIIQAIVTDYVYNELGKVSDLENWSKNGGLR